MSSTKLIVVLGATGNQGSSVVNTFLDAPGWRVRGITRNKSSEKAARLKSRGVEVAEADMGSRESLEAVFDGAQVIFSVSDTWGIYWDSSNKNKPKPDHGLNAWAAKEELRQLKNVIDATAKVKTLERFIFSSLSYVKKLSKGKYTHAYHLDGKAEAEEYGKQTYPDLWSKTSVFLAGFYLSNFIVQPMMAAKLSADGVVVLPRGPKLDTKVPFIAAEEDTGPIIKALVEEPSAGKVVLGFRELITFQQFLPIFIKATGRKTELHDYSSEHFKDTVPIAELKLELDDHLNFWDEFGYDGGEPCVIHPKNLKFPPTLASVDDYIRKQDWARILSSPDTEN